MHSSGIYQRFLILVAVLSIFIVLTSQPAANAAPQVTVTPQPASCADVLSLVEQHLSQGCTQLSQNEVCYGNPPIESTYIDSEATHIPFLNAGDISPINIFKSVKTGPLNIANGEWGLAAFKVNAIDLDNTIAGQAVTFISYGDAQLLGVTPNAPPPAQTLPPEVCDATVKRATRLRNSPNTNGAQLLMLGAGDSMKVMQRTADNAWIYGDVNGQTGWTFASNVDVNCAVNGLPFLDTNTPLIMPDVKAFYFTTTISAQTSCRDVPAGGIYMHGPDGQKVAFNVNGTDVVMGSSMILRAGPNGTLAIFVLEGEVTVTVGGVTNIIRAGNHLSIQLGGSDGLTAVGFVNEPLTISNSDTDEQDFITICNLAKILGVVSPCGKYLPTTAPIVPGSGPVIIAAVPTSIAPTATPSLTPIAPPPGQPGPTLPPSVITLNPPVLPNSTTGGVTYNQAITATGGTGPYTFAVSAGALPNGLTLSLAGALTGSPTVAAAFNFIVTATDSLAATGSQAYSITITNPPCGVVLNLNDTGPGSLRDQVAICPDGSMITFAGGLNGTITLSSGSITINQGLYIQGPGSGVIALDGGGVNRIFTIPTGSSQVAIFDLTLQNGNDVNGGAILVTGITQLNVTDNVFSNNTAASKGGAIHNTTGNGMVVQNNTFINNSAGLNGGAIYSNLPFWSPSDSRFINNTAMAGSGGAIYHDGGNSFGLSRSTFSGNLAPAGLGGAVYVSNVGAGFGVSIDDSTFDNNSSADGGALYFFNNVSAYVFNSTLTANSDLSFGGAITNNIGGLSVTSTTIANNSTGIHSLSGIVDLGSSIVAGSAGADLSGTFNSLDYNLIQNSAGATIIGTTANNLSGNPLLDPLSNYGGPTQTMRLQALSPAIERIPAPNCGSATDQRGNARPQGAQCDIGAYEFP